MASTILVTGNIKRVVRSQRLFKGVKVGAIRDKGWLVIVQQSTEQEGCWVPIHVIRRLK